VAKIILPVSVRQLPIEFGAKSTRIFYNALKASDRAGFQRMNGGLTSYSRKAAKTQR